MNDRTNQTPAHEARARVTPLIYRHLSRVLQILAICAALLPGGVEAAQKRVLAFGDSLTAGLGLPAEDTLPSQLQKLLKARGRDVEVVNAGVSGDTTATAVDRLDFALSGGPVDVAIIELGANDMLRGMSPRDARANLAKTIETFQSKGVTVVLAAMVSSNNWGQAYREEFDSIYPALATKYGVSMVPFFMEGVWGDPKLLIGDGLHPNAAGVQKIANKLAPYVEKALASAGGTTD